MFRFLKYVFLIAFLLSMVAMPAQTKSAQAAPVQQNCGSGLYCIDILIWFTCGPPWVNPPDGDYNGDLLIEIERISPFSYGTDYPQFVLSNGIWDLYQKRWSMSVPGTYRVRFREVDNNGWPDPSWSNWLYRTAPAEPLTFTFWRYDGKLPDGTCD